MTIMTDMAPRARAARLRTASLSHAAAYTVFAAATGFTMAVIFGLF
jgi:hypothetical protein